MKIGVHIAPTVHKYFDNFDHRKLQLMQNNCSTAVIKYQSAEFKISSFISFYNNIRKKKKMRESWYSDKTFMLSS